MTWLRFAFANLRLSPLSSLVNVLLMALGTASATLLLLASAQLSSTLARDARGIDLVIGAQGSPAQLILSAVYHADIPPGNIPLDDAQEWAASPRIELAAPLALGDSFRGFRIVGTTPDYFAITGASVASGRRWQGPMEAVIGAAAARSTGLGIGARFAGAHGLADGGHRHDEQQYEVVGILSPLGSVVDRLVLTSLESVWQLHGEPHGEALNDKEHAETHHNEKHDEEHGETHDVQDSDSANEREEADHGDDDHVEEPDHAAAHGSPEITAMLLRYRTPLAAMSLPREINASPGLQAAAPAMEIARILQLVGLGLDALRSFAWVLILTACLSVFAALYGSLRGRRGDLAMLRCLGATRREVFLAMLNEGMLLCTGGIIIGYALAFGGMAMIAAWLDTSRGVGLAAIAWTGAMTRLLGVLLAAGLLSAAIPAFQAYRTDVALTLARGGR